MLVVCSVRSNCLSNSLPSLDSPVVVSTSKTTPHWSSTTVCCLKYGSIRLLRLDVVNVASGSVVLRFFGLPFLLTVLLSSSSIRFSLITLSAYSVVKLSKLTSALISVESIWTVSPFTRPASIHIWTVFWNIFLNLSGPQRCRIFVSELCSGRTSCRRKPANQRMARLTCASRISLRSCTIPWK